MRISKIVKPLCFVGLVCVVNMLLSFLLEWANGASATMWEQYYAEEEIDIVFVGASVCSASFDPEVFDERLGMNSFNMGTPAQETEQSIRALEVAIEEHEIQTVIYGMGFFALQQDSGEEAEMTFVKALSREQGGLKGLKTSMEYLLSEKVRDAEKSVKYFFPWVYNGVDYSVDAIVSNVQAKLDTATEEFQPDSAELKNWRLEKGFRPFTGVVDYSTAWEANSHQFYYQYFDYESTYYFEQLLKLCDQKNVDLIVINSPHPAYDLVSCYDTYEMNHKQVEEMCEKYGVEYYDFSLAKPELFEAQEDFFYDFEHLNYKGAQAFSNAVCDLLEKRESKENLEESFYSVGEFMERHEELIAEWRN